MDRASVSHDTILKQPDKCVREVSEGEWNERGKQKRLFEEIMVMNVPNLIKTVNPHIQEAQQNMTFRNMKKVMPRHALISSLKTSDRE